MGTVYVAFQFDTEDFITPETDDILLDIIEVLDNFGVKGSFCIVGEKIRILERRGRTDILEALKRHDIAYQSNLHSVHPLISEYLKDKGWIEGVEEVKRREKPGIIDIERILGVRPSAFIQPGGSWAPQTPYALAEMGIPVYADGIFNDDPVWFCGAICFKASMGFPENSRWEDLDGLKRRFDEIYESKAGGGLLTIVMHPCKFVTEKFWDTINFSDGRNPPNNRLIPPPIREKGKIEESLHVFERFVSFILDHPSLQVVTFRDIKELYGEPEGRELNLTSIFKLARRAAGMNDWQVIDGVSISPAEMLRLFTDLIVDHLQIGEEPKRLQVHFTLGPTSKPVGNDQTVRISRERLIDALCSAKKFIDMHNEVPSAVKVENVQLGPASLLEASARIIIYYSEHGALPKNIELNGLPSLPEVTRRWNLAERVKRQWRWRIFPRGFESKMIEELTLLQTWSMRPAILNGQAKCNI